MSDVRIISPVGAPTWLAPAILDIERAIRAKQDAGEEVALGAASVTFTPAGTVAATDVQAAIEELDTDIGGKLNASAVSSFALTLLDDANAVAMRTTLGLWALATRDTVNNDYWLGADLSVANGGTGASTASAARTNLGVPAAANGVHTGTTQVQTLRINQSLTSTSVGATHAVPIMVGEDVIYILLASSV